MLSVNLIKALSYFEIGLINIAGAQELLNHLIGVKIRIGIKFN